jgi:hypothetical protein
MRHYSGWKFKFLTPLQKLLKNLKYEYDLTAKINILYADTTRVLICSERGFFNFI